jgi:hypothetical protein
MGSMQAKPTAIDNRLGAVAGDGEGFGAVVGDPGGNLLAFAVGEDIGDIGPR